MTGEHRVYSDNVSRIVVNGRNVRRVVIGRVVISDRMIEEYGPFVFALTSALVVGFGSGRLSEGLDGDHHNQSDVLEVKKKVFNTTVIDIQ